MREHPKTKPTRRSRPDAVTLLRKLSAKLRSRCTWYVDSLYDEADQAGARAKYAAIEAIADDIDALLAEGIDG